MNFPPYSPLKIPRIPNEKNFFAHYKPLYNPLRSVTLSRKSHPPSAPLDLVTPPTTTLSSNHPPQLLKIDISCLLSPSIGHPIAAKLQLFPSSSVFRTCVIKMQYANDGLPHYAAPPQDGPGSLYEAHRHQGLPNHHSVYHPNHMAVANHVMGGHPDAATKRDKDAIFG